MLSDVLQLFVLIPRDLRDTSLGSGGFLLMGTPVTPGKRCWQEHGVLQTACSQHKDKDAAPPATEGPEYL